MTCPTEHGISFSCSSHLDKKDILSKTKNEIALSKIRTILRNEKLPNKITQRAQYLIDFYKEFGTLVLPTTCVYQFIESEKHTVWQSFLFTGLSLAIRLETHICNFLWSKGHTLYIYTSFRNKFKSVYQSKDCEYFCMGSIGSITLTECLTYNK